MSTSCGWEAKGRYGSFRLWMKRRACTVQVKLCYPLTMRAIPERLRECFMDRGHTNRHYLRPLPLLTYLLNLLSLFGYLQSATAPRNYRVPRYFFHAKLLALPNTSVWSTRCAPPPTPSGGLQQHADAWFCQSAGWTLSRIQTPRRVHLPSDAEGGG